jgi:hypothetical protein
MINLDYVCIAMLQYQKPRLIEGDYIECLRIMMQTHKLNCSVDIIRIAERVKKILYEK